MKLSGHSSSLGACRDDGGKQQHGLGVRLLAEYDSIRRSQHRLVPFCLLPACAAVSAVQAFWAAAVLHMTCSLWQQQLV